MSKCVCSEGSSIMAEILAVKPDQYIEPEKGKGIFEVLDERMNDFEKAAFTVMKRYQMAIKEKVDLIESGEPKIREKSALEAEINFLRDKRAMVLHLMYFSIQDRLNRWGTPLGVSKGFKIIIPDEEENQSVKSITIAIPAGVILADILKGAISEAMKKAEGNQFDDLLRSMGDTGKVTVH